MKKRINIILIVISLILTLLVGCGISSSSSNNDKDRFVTVYKQRITGNVFYIILDTETNVEYLYIRSGYSGSITKLEKGE